jgi:hypothetical protein
MSAVERRDETGRAALSTTGLFEVLSTLESQDKTVRATSPWQDDPYDVFVSFAIFAVPMLAGVIVLRMFAWRAPGGPDRAHQLLRATGAMIALVWVTLIAEWAWAAVIVGCVAIQLAVAFRGALWSMLGAGELTYVPSLVMLTLGAGLVCGAATAVPLIARRRVG